MTEAVSGMELRQLLFAPDNMNTLFYSSICKTRCSIYLLHNTATVLHLWASGYAAEIEECVVGITSCLSWESPCQGTFLSAVCTRIGPMDNSWQSSTRELSTIVTSWFESPLYLRLCVPTELMSGSCFVLFLTCGSEKKKRRCVFFFRIFKPATLCKTKALGSHWLQRCFCYVGHC